MKAILLLVLSFACGAHADLEYRDYKPTYKVVKNGEKDGTPGTNITMPLFLEDKNNPGVASKINHILFTNTLGIRPPTTPDAKEADVMVVEDDDFYSYVVARNDDSVVAVEIHSEGCRASCGASNAYYNFDAKSGRQIHISSLFSKESSKKISSRLVAEWTKQIRNDLLEADEESLVRECIEHMKTNYGKGTPYVGFDYLIGKEGITFRRGSCWKHDGPYSTDLLIASLQDLLTPYGKGIYQLAPYTNQPTHPYGQVFDGEIGGKYKIKMTLVESYPSASYLEGSYFYEKYKTPIRLVAFIKGHTLEISERDDMDRETGNKIFAKATADGYKGHWEGKDKKLSFAIRFGVP